jgi:hypothetical protein
VNESQLINELCAALDDAAATVRAPAGTARRVRGRVRRRRLVRGLAAGVPAVGLAAGLVVALSGPSAPGRRHQVPQARATAGTHQADFMTVGYVTRRAKAALSKVSGSIVQSSGHGYVEWQYVATGAGRLEEFGPSGRLVSDEIWTFSGLAQHRIYVDYPARTWWQLTSKVTAVPKKPTAGILPVSGDSAGGQVSVLGHRTLAGRDTILVQYGPPRGFKPTASTLWATEQVWLDPTTYLPVQIKIFGAGPVEGQSLAYLPATPRNLARFAVTPPAGFRQVGPPPFRGDGRPGLGQIP